MHSVLHTMQPKRSMCLRTCVSCVYVCVCSVCVCMCVCVHVRVHVCVLCMCVCMCCAYVCACMCASLCVYVCPVCTQFQAMYDVEHAEDVIIPFTAALVMRALRVEGTSTVHNHSVSMCGHFCGVCVCVLCAWLRVPRGDVFAIQMVFMLCVCSSCMGCQCLLGEGPHVYT